jgi:aminobenzoyl-glutamate utilization protein B
LQESLDKPRDLSLVNEVLNRQGEVSKGSTDVGDVSWVAPTTGFSTACWVPGTPAHSWQAVAAGGTTIGEQGMVLAARVLAATAWDLAHDPATIEKAKKELAARLAGNPYEAMLEPGQKPPLGYRNPPKQ